MLRKYSVVIALLVILAVYVALLAYDSTKDNATKNSYQPYSTQQVTRIKDAREYLLALNLVQKARLRHALEQIDPSLYPSSRGAWDYFVATLNDNSALHLATEVRFSQDKRSDTEIAKDLLSKTPEKEHIKLIERCQACHKVNNQDES